MCQYTELLIAPPPQRTAWLHAPERLPTLAIALLALLVVAAGCRAFYANGGDFLRRHAELQQIAQGIDPIAAEQQRAAATAHPLASTPDGGYPPWSYTIGELLVTRLPIEFARPWFLGLNLVALLALGGMSSAAAARWAGRATWPNAPGALPMAALWAMPACSYAVYSCLNVGNYSIIVVALALGGLRLAERGQPLAAGIAFALAAVKPQVAVLFGVILLLAGRWTTVVTTALCIGCFSVIAARRIDGNPIAMTLAMFGQSTQGAYRDVVDTGSALAVLLQQDLGDVRLVMAVAGVLVCVVLLVIARRLTLLEQAIVPAAITPLWFYARKFDAVAVCVVLIALWAVTLNRRDRRWWLLAGGASFLYFLPAIDGGGFPVPGEWANAYHLSRVVWLAPVGLLLWCAARSRPGEPHAECPEPLDSPGSGSR